MSLRVVRSIGLVTVQDHGRRGHMHEGLPPGGALVPEYLAGANRHVGNARDRAAIEIMGVLTIVAQSPTTIATDREAARVLATGDEVTIGSGEARVTYLALAGGVDAPLVLGSRSTHLSAGIGALIKKGDVVETFRPDGHGEPDHLRARLRWSAAASSEAEGSPSEEPEGSSSDAFAIVIGPDLDAFVPGALDRLTSTGWTISAESSRVGTRLSGEAIGRRERADVTRPMVCGAIEVPPDGQPIVLGPEHPTTGGYPVIAVVAHADLGRFFATPVGKVVRFAV